MLVFFATAKPGTVMPIAEIFALIKSGGEALNAIDLEKIKKNWQVLRELAPRIVKNKKPHFALSAANESPLPSIESSTFVKRFNFARGLFIVLSLLATNILISIALAVWGPELAWFGPLFFATPLLLFFLVGFLINRNTVFAVGPHGIIDKQGGQRWFIARWIDIYELRDMSPHFGGMLVAELGDRTEHRPRVPKAAHAELARWIRQELPPKKFQKAEHLIRRWELDK